MKKVAYLTVSLFCVILFSCGQDNAAEGTKAFQNGNYSDAIKFLTMALQEDSTNQAFIEMISLSYFNRGEELYRSTRNLKTFSGNFAEGQKFIPADPSDSYNRQYAGFYVILASAYVSVRTKTEEEKDHYFDLALTSVKDALALDSTNTAAESLLVSLKDSHFQGLIDKGQELYNKARRTKNYDLYFSAEYYLKEAQKFESDNIQINDLLKKITTQTLPVLNYREDISIAVGGITRERKALTMNVSIKNYTNSIVKLLLNNFTLVDVNGRSYAVSQHEMKKRELFGESCIADTILSATHPMATGLIAFDAPQEVEIEYVNYQVSSQKSVRKYFR